MNRLQTIDADTLQSTAYEPVSFVVDDLLPQGLHLLAGAPKIGKSWLALWLCLCAAQGKPLWTFATRPCEVLYLCLEDSFQRIQSRLFDLTEDAPPTLHFAVMSQQLHNGLVEQIEQFLKEHPQTRLIVIDTLQRIRTAGNDANPYASDYRDIGVLKALADKHRIAILLVHHLRKMNDDDPMNMISGTTGLSGATDSNFVLRKSKRRENTATLYCTGRDIPYRELALEFDGEDHVWKLLSDDCEQTEQPNERILFLLSELLRRQPEISAPAKVLLEKIDPAGAEGLTPNSFSHRIRKSVDALRRNGITVSFRKSNGDRLICLKRVDGVDDPTTGNIVTIDALCQALPKEELVPWMKNMLDTCPDGFKYKPKNKKETKIHPFYSALTKNYMSLADDSEKSRVKSEMKEASDRILELSQDKKGDGNGSSGRRRRR